MNARHYDPELGHFTAPDSILPDRYEPQSLNRYSFVRNNPINRWDPTGHADSEVEDRKEPYLDNPKEQPEPGDETPNSVVLGDPKGWKSGTWYLPEDSYGHYIEAPDQNAVINSVSSDYVLYTGQGWVARTVGSAESPAGSGTATMDTYTIAKAEPGAAELEDGTVHNVQTDPKTGETKYTVTNPNGDQVIEWDDHQGTVTTDKSTREDGGVTKTTVEIKHPDGGVESSVTRSQTLDGGVRVTTLQSPDGTVTVRQVSPDGSEIRIVTSPDGGTTITAHNQDGDEITPR